MDHRHRMASPRAESNRSSRKGLERSSDMGPPARHQWSDFAHVCGLPPGRAHPVAGFDLPGRPSDSTYPHGSVVHGAWHGHPGVGSPGSLLERAMVGLREALASATGMAMGATRLGLVYPAPLDGP